MGSAVLLATLSTLGCSLGAPPWPGEPGQTSGELAGDEGSADGASQGTSPIGIDCEPGAEGCPCPSDGRCDDGLTCESGMCVLALGVCGDGVLDDAEECDHGSSNADDAMCKADCTQQVCGDGSVGPAEACDDGDDDDDVCTSECALPTCGDGELDDGEECDDGNDDDTDECLSTCLVARCGDGVVHDGYEACDDANINDNDECPNTCGQLQCGDGIVNDQTEECDDGNDDDNDGCTQTCACRLTFEDEAHTSGWGLTGDWGLYTQAPPTIQSSPVPFATQGQVFGTDGNRATPYPGAHAEVSTATTTSFIIPETLRFRSWHVDEGGSVPDPGTPGGSAFGGEPPPPEDLYYDTKRILVSVDAGATWSPLVDCAHGPNKTLSFCLRREPPRDEDDWNDIEIDTMEFAGVPGQLRFEYDTIDDLYHFEQGWFIDDINALDCP